jgi:RsmE family RNA methyltransferase
MNLILLDAAELGEGAIVRLSRDDRRAKHITRVLRADVGDRLRVGVVRGARGEARVLALADGTVTLELRLDAEPPPPPRLALALALPRPKALTRVLGAAASFGLRELVLLNAWRVDKSYWSSPRLEPSALEAALRDGCEQGQQTWLPEARRERLLMPYLERVASEPEAGPRLVAHPAGEPIERAVRGEAAARALLAVGPEGGWIEDELSAFARAGFRAVTLGAATLRSHDAVVAALAQLALLARV